MDSLGQRLKRFRLQRGFTQEELAEATKRYKPHGITRSMIGKIETGKRLNPSLETLQTLASALGVLIDDLVPSPKIFLEIAKNDPDVIPTSKDVMRRRIMATLDHVQDSDTLQQVLEFVEFIRDRMREA